MTLPSYRVPITLISLSLLLLAAVPAVARFHPELLAIIQPSLTILGISCLALIGLQLRQSEKQPPPPLYWDETKQLPKPPEIPRLPMPAPLEKEPEIRNAIAPPKEVELVAFLAEFISALRTQSNIALFFYPHCPKNLVPSHYGDALLLIIGKALSANETQDTVRIALHQTGALHFQIIVEKQGKIQNERSIRSESSGSSAMQAAAKRIHGEVRLNHYSDGASKLALSFSLPSPIN